MRAVRWCLGVVFVVLTVLVAVRGVYDGLWLLSGVTGAGFVVAASARSCDCPTDHSLDGANL